MTLGSGVDGAVRRIETAYDTAGRAFRFTSYDAASAGNIVNEVERSYNGLGQLITEWQAHGGAVNTSTSPKVQCSGRAGQLPRAAGDAWPVDRTRRRHRRRSSPLGRRVKQGSTALYYSADWQVLEERDGSGIARVSMVWSPVYIDAMIARDRDADTNGSLEERLYVAHDANFNVSSIINTSGSAVERFLLDPYGSPTFLNGSWSVIGSSAYAWTHLHQGGRQSSASSLYHFRHRDLSPHLGRWVMNDPIGFAAGASLISYLHQSPLVNSDPLGLCPRCGPVAVMMGNDGETKSEVGKTKRRRVWRPGMGDTCCKYTDGKYLEWNLADCSRFNNPVHCCAALNPAPGWRSLGPVSMSECPAAKCKDPYHMAPGEPPGQDVLRCMDECDTLYRELQAKRILDGKLFEIPGAHACMSVCYAECFNHGGDFKKAAQAVKDCLWAIEQIKKILEKVKIFD